MSLPTVPGPRRKERHLVEDIFILLCILVLWPVILGWKGLVYEVLLYVALAGLVFVLVRRIRRFQRACREGQEQRARD